MCLGNINFTYKSISKGSTRQFKNCDIIKNNNNNPKKHCLTLLVLRTYLFLCENDYQNIKSKILVREFICLMNRLNNKYSV